MMGSIKNLNKGVAIPGCLLALLCSPLAARAQQITPPANVATPSPTADSLATPQTKDDDAEYTADVASLTRLTQHEPIAIKRTLRDELRHLDQEWPLLMRDYINPLVRSLFVNHYHNRLMLNSTLLHYNNKQEGTLGAAVGQNDAQLSFTMRF